MQAHNLTKEDLQALKLKQVGGEPIETVPGNKEPSYEVPAHEQHLVHARIKTPQFNQTTGADEGAEIVQKFYPDEFKTIEKGRGFVGKKVTMLHSPEGDEKKLTPSKVKAMSAKKLVALREEMYKDGTSGGLGKDDLIRDILAKLNPEQ